MMYKNWEMKKNHPLFVFALPNILSAICKIQAIYLYIPPNHNMPNNIEGTFQKLHQGTFVWHLEEEISSLVQVDPTVKKMDALNKTK